MIVRLGGWLFRWRTWLPLPLAAAILTLPSAGPSSTELGAGVAAVAAGEALRLWAVRHIGAISRTRSERLGPLIRFGPFALVRNPLYIGNVLLWIGLALSAGLPWLALVAALLVGGEYHAIVRWEEGLLESRMGEEYREYARQVPRWVPGRRTSQETARVATAPGASAPVEHAPIVYSWRETLCSERGTLAAIAVGYGLLWLKFAVGN